MMSRALFRTALAIPLLLGLATACGGADALAPAISTGLADTTVVGSWLLERIDDRPLPYYYTGPGNQGGGVYAIVDGGTLRLERDGTYSTSMTLRASGNIPRIQATTGTFTADQGAVTLRGAGAATLTGTATQHSLMLAGLDPKGFRYAFVR